MKSLRLSILAFLVLPFAAAQAGDLDWSGVYRIEGNIFDNPQAGTGDKKRKEYGIHHLILRPKIVGADGLYINSQIEVFNNNAGATGAWGNQLGSVFGNGINDTPQATATTGGSGSSNTLSEHQGADEIRISQFYLTFVQEFGSLIAGRAPVDFGLGMTHNAGRGLFDHYADTRDLVGYKVVLGNFFILPMIAKVNEGGIGGYDDVNDQMIQIQYENPESETTMGFMYWNRKAGMGGNDATPGAPASADEEVFGAGATLTGSYDYKLMSFFFGKKYESFGFGIEVANQSGKTGVTSGAGDGVDYSGIGLATEFEYHPKDSNWAWGLKAGMASGDDKTTEDEYEGFVFDKNYDVALMLFNHALGQANLLHTEIAGTRISSATTSSTLADPDVEAISNVMYAAPYFNYKWSDKWSMRGVVATGWIDQTKLAIAGPDVDNSLGYEVDFSLNYSPNERVVWQNTIGWLMPGTAFEADGAFNTGDVFGIMSRAAISF